MKPFIQASKNRNDKDIDDLSQFGDAYGPLEQPITNEETLIAISKLRNNRSPGKDELPGELYKYGGDELIRLVTKIFN